MRHLSATIVNRSGSNVQSALLLLITSFLVALTGCDSAAPTAPEAPSGGQSYALDYDAFVATVAPALSDQGCDNSECHGGGIRGTFELSPASNKNYDLDFFQVGLQVNGEVPSQSPILLKPLDEAAGGVAHTANSELFGFMSTDDPNYQAILAWIEAGEFE